MIYHENPSAISARQSPSKDPAKTRQNSRRATAAVTLTEQAALGLFFIQRYRFLTIDQFARAAGLLRKTAANQLWRFETHGFLGHFGNTAAKGHGKTPKAYFLTRKGWELLSRESDIPPEILGTHKEIYVEARWSPQMYHRLRTVDLMLSAEIAVRQRPNLSMVATFLEYRRVKRGGRTIQETSDYISADESPLNRIIPDAAFILENIQTKRRALFFIEMDMATERIVSLISRDSRLTLHHKFSQYDRYITSGRFKETYREYGEFRAFTLLFVTLQDNRVMHIRRELEDLPAEFAASYRLTTFAKAMGDLLGPIWHSRLPSDAAVYPLVREETAVAS